MSDIELFSILICIVAHRHPTIILFFYYSSEQVVKLCQKIPNLKYELIGSWSVRVGDLDQYVHLWKHQGGYAEIDKTNTILIQNQVSFSF